MIKAWKETIAQSSDLDELVDNLNDILDTIYEEEDDDVREDMIRDFTHGINWTSFPTFGDEPSSTVEVWSYDDDWEMCYNDTDKQFFTVRRDS